MGLKNTSIVMHLNIWQNKVKVLKESMNSYKI